MINQYTEVGLDLYLRFASMILLIIFFIFTLRLSRKAKEVSIDVKKNYFLSFSLFFLMFFINFFWTELDLAGIIDSPELIDVNGENSFQWFFITQATDNVWMFFFFFLGAAPLSFAIERYLLMHKKIPITIICIVAVFVNVTLFLVPTNIYTEEVKYVLTYINTIFDWLAIVIVVLILIILYLRIAIISTGSLRAVGLLMFFGFILNVTGVILTSDNSELGHGISLVGFILIFISITQMK